MSSDDELEVEQVVETNKFEALPSQVEVTFDSRVQKKQTSTLLKSY